MRTYNSQKKTELIVLTIMAVVLMILVGLMLDIPDVDAQTVGSTTPISQLPYGGLLLPSDQVVANRSATTMRMVPFQMPATGSVMISNGTLAPSGILPVNGECLVGTGSAWVAQTCPSAAGSVTWPNSDDIVVSNSSDAPLGLAPTDTDVLIGNGSAWQQKAFSGDCTLADTGAITCTESNGVTIATTTGTQTLTNKSIDGSEINSGTVTHTYLPTGSGSAPGILQCGTNTSCSTGTISVPAGTSSAQGALECGTNTSCSGGTISVPTGSSSTVGVLECGTGTTCSGGVISTSGTSIVSVHKQVFTSSGTYTPCTGLLYGDYIVVGGGGGGGGVNNSNPVAAGGGGAGGIAEIIASAATVGSSQSITIGSAGTGGANTGGTGGTGGTTSMGSIISATGGNGGVGSTSGNTSGGTGGTGSNGALNLTGATGGSAVNGPVGGFGAGSIFGTGAPSNITGSEAGINAVTPGTGGSGASSTGTSSTGGTGAKGIFIATEYCSQ